MSNDVLMRSTLDDAAKLIGQQRERIAKLEAVLKDQLGYLKLWFDDIECGVKPYLDGFERAEKSIHDALKTGEAK